MAIYLQFVYNEILTNTPWYVNCETSATISRYQVAIDIRRKNPLIVERGAALVARFTENLVPGKTYQVGVVNLSSRLIQLSLNIIKTE